MADIAASGVTYTKSEGQDELTGSSKYRAIFTVAFGDGTDTYPSGGVPLTKAKLGCPTVIESLNIIEEGNGYKHDYDVSAETVRIYQEVNDGSSSQPLTELVAGTSAVAATSLIVEVIGW